MRDAEEEAAQKAKEDALKASLEKDEKKKRIAREMEAERLWGLTPSFLKELLPGKGAIKGQFSAQYHPFKDYFRVNYPSLLAPASFEIQVFGFGQSFQFNLNLPRFQSARGRRVWKIGR